MFWRTPICAHKPSAVSSAPCATMLGICLVRVRVQRRENWGRGRLTAVQSTGRLHNTGKRTVLQLSMLASFALITSQLSVFFLQPVVIPERCVAWRGWQRKTNLHKSVTWALARWSLSQSVQSFSAVAVVHSGPQMLN